MEFKVQANPLLNGYKSEDNKGVIVRSGDTLLLSEDNYAKVKAFPTAEESAEFMNSLHVINLGDIDFDSTGVLDKVSAAPSLNLWEQQAAVPNQ